MINFKICILASLLSAYTFSHAQQRFVPPPPLAPSASEIYLDDLDKPKSEEKKDKVINNQDFDASYSESIRKLFGLTPEKENPISNPSLPQNNGIASDNSNIRNTLELSVFEKIEKLFSEDKLKDALALSRQLAASKDVSAKSDGLFWLAHIYRKDRSLNNTNRKPIDLLKQSADLGSVRSIARLARIYASFYEIPFYIAWNIEPDDKLSEFYYNKLLVHPNATDEERKSARSAIPLAINARAIEYIQSPKRVHKLNVVCLDSESIISFIDRPLGPWSDYVVRNCRAQPINVTGDKLRVVRQWYRGSQRIKPTYVVRINAGSQIAFGFIDTP